MRILFFVSAFVNTLIACTRAIAVVIDVVCDLVMVPFRLDYGTAYQVAEKFVLSAFRVLGLLKPEYHDSLETSAQNFRQRHRFDPLC